MAVGRYFFRIEPSHAIDAAEIHVSVLGIPVGCILAEFIALYSVFYEEMNLIERFSMHAYETTACTYPNSLEIIALHGIADVAWQTLLAGQHY